MADFAGIAECMLRVCLGGYGIAKYPQSHRPIGLVLSPYVSAKSRRKRTMSAGS